MIPCRCFAALVSILAFVVGCANQDDPHRGVEIGADNAAVDAVFTSWDQPGSPGCALGVYPETGYFTKPNWNFIDIISPADLVTEALGWVAAGVRLLGGCCGTSPDHIKALKAAMPELEAARSA
jgi:S-methylmethionine-dependent homocysteine/selenocysteine methylase